MRDIAVDARGRVLAFTTLHSAPAGFRSPLHIVLVALGDGGRLVCHGGDTKHLHIGARVAIEKVDDFYYLSDLGIRERAVLVWRRTRSWSRYAGALAAAAKGTVLRLTSSRQRGEPE